MPGMNFLYIISDQHTRGVTGCYGDPIVKTPNMDRLAARGTRFSRGYTPAPICAPARVSAATGLYTCDHHCWDQAHPYDGRLPSWGHRLSAQGHEVVSVGKQHFRSTEDDYGFTEEALPMHLHLGMGDLVGCQRNPPEPRTGMHRLAIDVGPGESPYTRQDRKVAEYAADWIATKASACDKPWAMTVGFILPHFPLFAPQEFYDPYPLNKMPLPRLYEAGDAPTHPVLRTLHETWNYDDFFDDDDTVRRNIAGYCACVSYVDAQVGRVLDALDASGLTDETCVVYTSDHGDSLGNRHMWGKFTMYEESIGVPFIVAGPGIPMNAVNHTPVSLVDIFPTAVDCVGLPLSVEDQERLPGASLLAISRGGSIDRDLLSEYHAAGSVTGIFGLLHDKWKYVHYEGYQPQLFDREADPGEVSDLGGDPNYREVIAMCHERLLRMVDPAATNRRAFADQRALIARYGGLETCRKLSEEVQKLGFTPPPDDVPAEDGIRT